MDVTIDPHLLLSFTIAALFETLNPGPTVALVFETRASKGTQAAGATVVGITLANMLGVLIGILVGNVGVGAGDWVFMWIRTAAAGYLVFLASRRILSSTVMLIAGITDKVSSNWWSYGGDVGAGLLTHLSNPLTLPFYLGFFAATAAPLPVGTKLLLGAIAVVLDLIVYGAAAKWQPRWMEGRDSGGPVIAFRLIAGAAFLYLVERTFSSTSPENPELAIAAPTTLAMFIGFVVAAIREAQWFVKTRHSKNNKLLWRVVSLWSAMFSVYALIGGLYTLISDMSANTFTLDAIIESRLRICVVVAAVTAASLSFAKALGELQDERSSDAPADAAIAVGWQALPERVTAAALLFLLAIFALLNATGFRIQ
jgi:threonine/homoserine/homoserine lactone efflux protein